MAAGIVTGCGQGIGLATTGRLLRQGDQVVGISRTLTPGISGLLRRFDSSFHFVECDIGNTEQLSRSLGVCIDVLPSIDYAVANAGIRSRSSVNDSSLDLYTEVFGVNTLAQIHLTKILVDKCHDCRQQG